MSCVGAGRVSHGSGEAATVIVPANDCPIVLRSGIVVERVVRYTICVPDGPAMDATVIGLEK